MNASGMTGSAHDDARRGAHVIVCGNEKGGSGKSTTAMHIAVALLRSGYKVATVDLDSRQLSLTRYVENRSRWARKAGLELAVPHHMHVPPARREIVADAEQEEFRQLSEGLAGIDRQFDFVIVDTPGADTFLSRLAHRIADTLVTPMNDSFVDLDLLARIDLWTFALPGLAERPEDIEPNLEYELARWAARHKLQPSFTREARLRFLEFATSPEAAWTGNFRDFAACIERMSTLAEHGRITIDNVREEIERLRRAWQRPLQNAGRAEDALERVLDHDRLARLDPFDRVQLNEVLRVCARSRSLSEAGRYLFASSRQNKSSTNDADRLRKYLAKYGLRWQEL